MGIVIHTVGGIGSSPIAPTKTQIFSKATSCKTRRLSLFVRTSGPRSRMSFLRWRQDLRRRLHSLVGYQCAIDRLRAILTVIVAASLSTEPHGPVTLAQNCVVCVSTGLVMASPDPTGAEVLPDAPWNHVTETFGSPMPTINLTVVPAAAC